MTLMTRAEYRQHELDLAAARKLRPSEHANLIAARARRDATRTAWDKAGVAWVEAEASRHLRENQGDTFKTRLEDIDAAREVARIDHEDACRSLGIIEWDNEINRRSRVVGVDVFWQTLVDDRTRLVPLPTIGTVHVRTFDSPEERDAAYAARRAAG